MLDSVTITKSDFQEGKLSALRVLYESFSEMEIKAIKAISTRDLLQVIRTLILNLERRDTS